MRMGGSGGRRTLSVLTIIINKAYRRRMTSPRLPLLALTTAAIAALALVGCAPGDTDSTSDRLQIVASTNVYASIASAIAGDGADVEAIIDDIALDPHEYEATTRDALALDRADLVIMNGGGYDEFMSTLLGAQSTSPVVIDAVEIADHDDEDGAHAGEDHADDGASEGADEHAGHDHSGHDHGEVNEHVWYDLHAMSDLAHEIADALAELDPDGAAEYQANAEAFVRDLDEVHERAHAIADSHEGLQVASTEPVPHYLLELAGLSDATPAEFTRAVESGVDAPVLVVQDVLELVSGGTVAFLAYNEQTVSPQTQEVLAAAGAAGLPVVSFSELLPEGLDYIEWMSSNVDAIQAAVS